MDSKLLIQKSPAVHKLENNTSDIYITNIHGVECKEGKSCPCRASDDVPMSSPLWDVDCFSLSDRPQVRCRERKRCDYQSSMQEVLDEKRVVDNNQLTMQLVASILVFKTHDNYARMLIKSIDVSDKEQMQC